MDWLFDGGDSLVMAFLVFLKEYTVANCIFYDTWEKFKLQINSHVPTCKQLVDTSYF